MDDASFMPLSSMVQGEKPKTRRIYLTRNGESCDHLGPAWRHKAFPEQGQYRIVDLNQPVKIIDRAPDAYKNDSPLTQVGSVSSQLLGRGMSQRNAGVHTVFSSPTLRCIQTASSIIGTLNMKNSPNICIEPGLIDPLAFYWQDRLPSFLTSGQLSSSGLAIEAEYEPCYNLQYLAEHLFHEKTPEDFSERIRKIAAKIVDSSKERIFGGVLVVCGAPVIDAIMRIITESPNRPRNISDLHRMGLSYPHSSVTTLEQNPQSMKWNVAFDALPPLTYMHFSTAIQIPLLE